jgi:cyclophilin family peptidyl-prolyl cis-trans isomerase
MARSMTTTIRMQTTLGEMRFRLFDEHVPKTTANFKTLTQKGFYNGLAFHRIIKDFMVQGGCPKGNGTGGPGYMIPDEFSPTLRHTKKGLLSMANAGPNTGGSQFFITLAATPWLDNKHAIFGEIVSGMDVLEKIGATKTDAGDKPLVPVKMEKVEVSAYSAVGLTHGLRPCVLFVFGRAGARVSFRALRG